MTLFLLIAILVGCSSESTPATNGPSPEATAPPTTIAVVDSLECPDCELVEVIDIIDANTLRTAIGEIGMYGAYVVDQPADCAVSAAERLKALAGDAVRIEPGPPDTIRNDSNHYYLYTVNGQSIEEKLVREGLALNWTQDGQHLGWFVFRGADARIGEAGCLWKGYNAFQRGEPSEFRIPGLSYPDSD